MQQPITGQKSQTLKEKKKKKGQVQFKTTCCGVPSKSLPHDKLKKVSPVKISPDPGKQKLIWLAYSINKKNTRKMRHIKETRYF